MNTWFKKAKIINAQALNIVGPATNIPSYVQPSNPAELETPEQQSPQTMGTNIVYPPAHERCHCYITNVGGKQYWQTSNNACQMCIDAQSNFNSQYAS